MQLFVVNPLPCRCPLCPDRTQKEHQSYSISHGSDGKSTLVLLGSWDIESVSLSYTGSDPIGVELAGALKNVYAIAAGIAEGLGYENNTRAGMYADLPL